MEHTPHAAVVPVEMGWSDVGTWDALWQIGAQGRAGNVAAGDVVAEDTRNSYLRAEAGLLAALGVEDLVVVTTADAVMVARRDRAQDSSSSSPGSSATAAPSSSSHPLVHRPWGTYRSIHNGERVQVKHIMVKPGANLSLQMHHHRAEHWVVVHGTAKVVRGNEELMLHENQSTYIPHGHARTGSRIPARSRSISSRCSRAPISARTISSASRTPTAAPDRRKAAPQILRAQAQQDDVLRIRRRLRGAAREPAARTYR